MEKLFSEVAFSLHFVKNKVLIFGKQLHRRTKHMQIEKGVSLGSSKVPEACLLRPELLLRGILLLHQSVICSLEKQRGVSPVAPKTVGSSHSGGEVYAMPREPT